MDTERLLATKAADLKRAAELLREGSTVAFPTETVYGLGANAFSAAAVDGIFVAKQRPRWDPLIVHVAGTRGLEAICRPDPLAERLMDAFWPGPLTLLLPRTGAIPDSVTAGRSLVGVRIPAHPCALELLRLTEYPVAAPSANRFGHTSPTSAFHVLEDLDGRIGAVLDGGETAVGVESTVVEVQGRELVIYRAGAVTAELLRGVAGVERVSLYHDGDSGEDPAGLPSPGVGIRHYAPRATVMLTGGTAAEVEQALAVAGAKTRVGVMLPESWSALSAAAVFEWGRWGEPEVLARRLFAGLRALDAAGVAVIVCPLPGPGGLKDALRDRLMKAARLK